MLLFDLQLLLLLLMLVFVAGDAVDDEGEGVLEMEDDVEEDVDVLVADVVGGVSLVASELSEAYGEVNEVDELLL